MLNINTKTSLMNNYTYGSKALSGPKPFTFQQPDGKIIHILQHPTQQNTLVFQLQNSQNLKNNSKTGFQELIKTFSPSFGAQFDWTVEYHESSQVLLFIICAYDYTYARIYLNQFDSNGLSDLESWIQNSGSSQTRGMLAGGNDPIVDQTSMIIYDIIPMLDNAGNRASYIVVGDNTNKMLFSIKASGNSSGAGDTLVPVNYGIQSVSAITFNNPSGHGLIYTDRSGHRKIGKNIIENGNYGAWSEKTIVIPRSQGQSTPGTITFSSYTSTISVADTDKSQVNTALYSFQLSASKAPMMVEVNGDFYDLPYGGTPVTITSKSPVLTLIQEAKHNIFQAYNVNASSQNSGALSRPSGNPMHDFFVSHANISQSDIASSPLGQIVTDPGNQQLLANVIQKISANSGQWGSSFRQTRGVGSDVGHWLSGALNWLENAINKVTITIEDDLTLIIKFVDKEVNLVIDSLEHAFQSVVAFIMTIANDIAAVIEKIIEWIGMLFDIAEYKACASKLSVFSDWLMDKFSDIAKTDASKVTDTIKNAKNTIDGVVNGGKLSGANRSENISDKISASSNVLSYHLTHQAGNVQDTAFHMSQQSDAALDSFLATLKTNVDAFGSSISSDVKNKIIAIANDFKSGNLGNVVLQIAGLVADIMLDTAVFLVQEFASVVQVITSEIKNFLTQDVYI